jgi:hypothetical protein
VRWNWVYVSGLNRHHVTGRRVGMAFHSRPRAGELGPGSLNNPRKRRSVMFTVVLGIRYEYNTTTYVLNCIATKVTLVLLSGTVYIVSKQYDVVTPIDLSSLVAP